MSGGASEGAWNASEGHCGVMLRLRVLLLGGLE